MSNDARTLAAPAGPKSSGVQNVQRLTLARLGHSFLEEQYSGGGSTCREVQLQHFLVNSNLATRYFYCPVLLLSLSGDGQKVFLRLIRTLTLFVVYHAIH